MKRWERKALVLPGCDSAASAGSGSTNRRQPTWPLAAQQQSGAHPSPAEHLLRLARTRYRGVQARRLIFAEPPYTDPYVRWCGRGGAARLPPIPIFGPSQKLPRPTRASAYRGYSGRWARIAIAKHKAGKSSRWLSAAIACGSPQNSAMTWSRRFPVLPVRALA